MIDVVDDLGDVTHHPHVPRRVVSLVPSLTESIASWGIEPVGVTDWCTHPDLPRAQRVRGTKNPDIAAIVALAPDVVLADQEENRLVDVERLRAAGVRVHVTAPRSVLAAADALARVADLLGVAQAGDDLAARIRAAVATPPERRITTFCPVWRDPWIAVGTDTVAGDLLAQAGFTTVPEAPRYPRVELDDVRALAPQVVLLPSEPYEFGERDLAAFDGWDADVRFIDGQVLTWWGPRTPDAVAALRALAATCRPVAR